MYLPAALPPTETDIPLASGGSLGIPEADLVAAARSAAAAMDTPPPPPPWDGVELNLAPPNPDGGREGGREYIPPPPGPPPGPPTPGANPICVPGRLKASAA